MMAAASSLDVRKAVLEDVRGAALVYQAAFNERVKPRTIASKIDDPDFILGVAEERGVVLGFVLVAKSRDPAKFNVHYVCAHPIDAPKGTGRALMFWAEAEAVVAGATHIRLAVRRDNSKARSFYAGLGYAVLEARDAGFTLIKKVSR
jgi:ribosomal protein S18 acetylase RimI-like enzyme